MRTRHLSTHAPLAILFAVPLALFGGSGCQKKKGSAGQDQGGPASGSGGAKAAGFVSDPAAVARGWVPAPRDGSRFAVDGAPKRYNKETIFELLNGGADTLLEMGLTSLLHVRLRDGAKVFADVEIQVMDVTSPPKAVAMLMKEKAPGAREVRLGDRAYAEQGGVLFARGRHLVRVTALPAGSRKPAPVSEIARLVAATPGAAW